MTKTIIATITVSESGSVTSETYVDDSVSEVFHAVSSYGAPWIGQFDTSEEWRQRLGDYVALTAYQSPLMGEVGACQGHVLKYVSPGCNVYVYEIDFEVR